MIFWISSRMALTLALFLLISTPSMITKTRTTNATNEQMVVTASRPILFFTNLLFTCATRYFLIGSFNCRKISNPLMLPT